ncbi:MAG: phosphatase PAP2 family protein, partial [Eggerthellaceae bacterium]|nr:phosphatase PAP2 family protein [Eggerthellaceae bacterium]
MYQEFYERISRPFRAPGARRAIAAIDKTLVVVVAVTFLGIGVWLALHQDVRVVRYLAVCAVSFAALSALRAKLNRPRPYEAFDIDPLIRKETRGKSFPSRHVFSAAMIACALLWLNTWLGIAGFIATAALGVLRVIEGVHFPRDIVAGALLGIACGIL